MADFESYRTPAIVPGSTINSLSLGLRILRFFMPYRFWHVVHVEIKRFKSSYGSFDQDHLIMYLERKPLLFSHLLPNKKRVIVSDEYSQRYKVEFYDLDDGRKLLKQDSQHFWDLWRYWERRQDYLKVIEHGTKVES